MGLQYWFNSPHASVPHAVLSNYVGRLSILHSPFSTLVRKSFEVSQNALQNFSSHTHSTVSMRECVCVTVFVRICACVCLFVCAHFDFYYLKRTSASASVQPQCIWRPLYGFPLIWLPYQRAQGTGGGRGKGHNCLGAGYGFRFFVCVCVNLATKQRKMYKNRWMFCGPHGNRLRKNIDAVGQHWLDPKPKSE